MSIFKTFPMQTTSASCSMHSTIANTLRTSTLFVALFLAIAILPGCAVTSRLNSAIDHNADLGTEFNAPPREPGSSERKSTNHIFAIAPGLDAGDQMISGESYKTFVFEHLLAGKRRKLRIAIPRSNSHPSIVSDEFSIGPVKDEGGSRFAPHIAYASSVSDQRPKYGQEVSFLSTLGSVEALLVLDVTTHRYDFVKVLAPDGVARQNTIYLSMSQYPEENRIAFIEKGARLTSMRDFRMFKVKYEIGWHERSTFKNVLLHSAYVLSVPIDVVTFPIQALFAGYAILYIATNCGHC